MDFMEYLWITCLILFGSWREHSALEMGKLLFYDGIRGLVHHQAAICTTEAQCTPWCTRETPAYPQNWSKGWFLPVWRFCLCVCNRGMYGDNLADAVNMLLIAYLMLVYDNIGSGDTVIQLYIMISHWPFNLPIFLSVQSILITDIDWLLLGNYNQTVNTTETDEYWWK